MSNVFAMKLPLGAWVEEAVDWLSIHLVGLFQGISWCIDGVVQLVSNVMTWIPPIVLILLVVLALWRVTTKATTCFVGLGLLLVWHLGYWQDTMLTFALVFTSAAVALLFGIPLGILCARHDKVAAMMQPLLDFMQTMPAFVYLIPAVFFFGTGSVPGVLASVIFAMPPTIRMTNLGIRQVPQEMVEAADAFGATPRQKLFGVQLPLAKSTMMAGINQSIMLSLSMVVIGAMIGAKGLGSAIYRSVTQIKIGLGFEAGLAVVVLAIALDRLTQGLGRERKEPSKLAAWLKAHLPQHKAFKVGVVGLLLLCVLGGVWVHQTHNHESFKAYDASQPLANQMPRRIQGIDPGAGIMEMTRQAVKDYGLSDWDVQEASDSAMMAELDAAYKKKAPIVITGWTPHWMFQAYDLKYLDDPKGSYGTGDDIYTLVRQGLQEDDPVAYTLFDRFEWRASDMEEVMNQARSKGAEQAAKDWVASHQDMVDAWVAGLPQQSRDIKIAYVAWDSEIASTYVLSEVFSTRLGYRVDKVQLDMGPMYAAIAQGDVDGMVAAWLPNTAKHQYETFKDRVVNLGPNLYGTRLGLVVPAYMENVHSIEDLVY